MGYDRHFLKIINEFDNSMMGIALFNVDHTA